MVLRLRLWLGLAGAGDESDEDGESDRNGSAYGEVDVLRPLVRVFLSVQRTRGKIIEVANPVVIVRTSAALP